MATDEEERRRQKANELQILQVDEVPIQVGMTQQAAGQVSQINIGGFDVIVPAQHIRSLVDPHKPGEAPDVGDYEGTYLAYPFGRQDNIVIHGLPALYPLALKDRSPNTINLGTGNLDSDSLIRQFASHRIGINRQVSVIDNTAHITTVITNYGPRISQSEEQAYPSRILAEHPFFNTDPSQAYVWTAEHGFRKVEDLYESGKLNRDVPPHEVEAAEGVVLLFPNGPDGLAIQMVTTISTTSDFSLPLPRGYCLFAAPDQSRPNMCIEPCVGSDDPTSQIQLQTGQDLAQDVALSLLSPEAAAQRIAELKSHD